MAKPTSTSSGTLIIPIEDFNAWCNSLMPPGPFYTFSKPKEKQETLEVTFTSSTAGVPPPPPA